MPTAAVAISHLNLRLGDKLVIDDLTLDVQVGETLGLLGPNGAGKTTTIRSIVTILKPNNGTVAVFGKDVTKQSTEVRRLIGYVPQALSADSGLTGRQNVTLFAKLFDVPRKVLKSRVDEAINAMDLAASADNLVSTYSGGMIRRLELAQALVNVPRLLILDEPTIGLDPLARKSLWEQVQKLKEHFGITVLLTTHYMEEADALCNRVAMLHRGKLQAVGTPAELKAQVGQGATLEDVFRNFAGSDLDEGGDARSVRASRRTAKRLG